MSGESKNLWLDGCCSDERSDAQPARRSTDNTKNKVVVLKGREESPNETQDQRPRNLKRDQRKERGGWRHAEGRSYACSRFAEGMWFYGLDARRDRAL